MSSYTTTEELLANELFFIAYLSAIEETPDDISRLLSEFKELKIKSSEILQTVDSTVGYGSARLPPETKTLVEDLLKEYCTLQDEMTACTGKLEDLICGVTTKLHGLAAVSNPNSVVKTEKVDLPELVPDGEKGVVAEGWDVIAKVVQKRGRRSKKLPNVLNHAIHGLDLLANAVSLVSTKVEKEAEAKTKKVPITKFNKKSRKRGKNSEAGGSKDEEQSDDFDDVADDSGGKPDEDLFCVCNRPSFGNMVCCENESCSIEWFHFECVKLKKEPPGKWYCPKCRGRKSNVIKKELEATVVKYQKYTRTRQKRNSL